MPRNIPLEQLVIREPCPERWDAMIGDDRRRYCSRCRKHVHDLGSLPRREAEELVTRACGELCVRMPAKPPRRYRRAGRALVLPLAAVALVAILMVGFVRGLHEGSALHVAYLRVKAVLSPAATPPPLMGMVMPMGRITVQPAPVQTAAGDGG